MAVIDPNERVRLDIPHEPGEWVELRPLDAGVAMRVTRVLKEDPYKTYGYELAREMLAGWSYATPLDVEKLDARTLRWLLEAVNDASDLRSDDEKKVSETNSSDGSQPRPLSIEPELGPGSSVT